MYRETQSVDGENRAALSLPPGVRAHKALIMLQSAVQVIKIEALVSRPSYIVLAGKREASPVLLPRQSPWSTVADFKTINKELWVKHNHSRRLVYKQEMAYPYRQARAYLLMVRPRSHRYLRLFFQVAIQLHHNILEQDKIDLWPHHQALNQRAISIFHQ